MTTHHNKLGQVCDGTRCEKCTRCSNCSSQKPGEYKTHHCVFNGVKAALVTRHRRVR